MVTPLDFTTALARLLRDGALRDEFRENGNALADAWNLGGEERASILALDPDDLDFQARVLLRKRYSQIEHIIPATCRALGADAWPVFYAYARTRWPEDELRDAHAFCMFVKERNPEVLCTAEWNRLNFITGTRRIAFHLAGPALQILLRRRNGGWREWAVNC